jgi:hypothetical protein
MGKPNRSIRDKRQRPNLTRLLDLNGNANADRNVRSQDPLPAIPADFSVSFLCRRSIAQNVRSFIAIGDSDNNQYTIRGGASGFTAAFGLTVRLGATNLVVATNPIEKKIVNQDTDGDIVYGIANFIPSENKVQFFLNGLLDWEETDVLFVPGTTPPATSIYNIGTFFNLNPVNSALASIGKLALYDRPHTVEEALASFFKGGEPAKSMYGNVISFVPFNEKYAPGSVIYGSTQEFNHFKPVNTVLLGSTPPREGFGGWTDDDGGTLTGNSVLLSLPDLSVISRSSKLFFTRGASYVDINFLFIGDASITTKECRVKRTSDDGLIKTVTITATGTIRISTGSINEPFYLELFFDKTGTGTGNQIVQWNQHDIKVADFPIRLDLNNYLAGEVGETEPATTEKAGISYDRLFDQLPNNWGLRSDGVDQGAKDETLSTPINLGNYDNGIYLDFIVHETDANIPFLVDGFNQSAINDPSFYIRHSVSGGGGYTLRLWLFTDFTNFHRATIRLTGGQDLQFNKRYRLLLQYIDEDFANAEIFIDNKPADITPQGVAGSAYVGDLIVNSLAINQIRNDAVNFYGHNTVFDLAFLDGILTPEERKDLFKDGLMPAGKLVERFRFEKRSDANVNSDILGNTLALLNYNLPDFHTYYKALPGGFSEPVQALDLTTERLEISGFAGLSNLVEWTLTQAYSKAEDQFDLGGDRYFFSGGVFPTEYFYINSTPVANQLQVRIQKAGVGLISAFIEDVDIGKIHEITVRQSVNDPLSPTQNIVSIFINARKVFEQLFGLSEYDLSSQDPYYINSFTSGGLQMEHRLIQFAINFRALSDDEILEAHNHQQFDGLPDDTELVLNMNQGSFSEDGVDVLVLNEGREPSLITKAVGFTGATSADRLTDLLSKLVTVNSLR